MIVSATISAVCDNEADAVVPAEFQEEFYRIDETAEALLRDSRGFAGPHLRSA